MIEDFIVKELTETAEADFIISPFNNRLASRIQNYDEALTRAAQAGDTKRQAELLLLLAKAHSKLDKARALDYVLQGIAVITTTGNIADLSVCSTPISSVNTGNPGEPENLLYLKASFHQLAARFYALLGSNSEAVNNLNQVLSLGSKLNRYGLVYYALTKLARIAEENGETLVAISYWKDKLTALSRKRVNPMSRISILLQIARLYKNLGEHQQVIYYCNQVLSLITHVKKFHVYPATLKEYAVISSIERFTAHCPAEKAANVIHAKNNSLNIIRGEVYIRVGTLLPGIEKHTMAAKCFNKALGNFVCVKYLPGKITCYFYLASYYRSTGDTTKAISILNKLHQILINTNDREKEAQCLREMGEAYIDISEQSEAIFNNRIEDAERLLLTAQDIFTAENNLSELVKVLMKLGQLKLINSERGCWNQQSLNAAISYYEQAVSLLNHYQTAQNNNSSIKVIDKPAEAILYFSLALAYNIAGEAEKTALQIDNAILIAQAMSDKQLIARMLFSRAINHSLLNRPEQASQDMQEALKLTKEMSMPVLIGITRVRHLVDYFRERQCR